MWLSDVNAILFLVFFGFGCWLSYRSGYLNGINANLVFHVVNPQELEEIDEDDPRY